MIRRLAICVCSLLFMAGAANAQDEKLRELPPLPAGVKNVGDPAKIKAVLARENDLRKAYTKLDAKLATDLYSEDYLQLTMGAWCCFAPQKAQIAALIEHRDRKPPEPIDSITDEQVVVRIHGNSAVVTGVQTVKGMGTMVRLLFMNVWSLDKGKWRIIGGSRKML